MIENIPGPSQTASDERGTKETPTLTDIMKAIADLRFTPEHKIYTLSVEMTLIRAEPRKDGERKDVIYDTVESITGNMKDTRTAFIKLQDTAHTLGARVEDTGRRNHL
ncbi:hypothetical protein NDU88_002263 [Pleurodeles waltl]|uniref:Uncharacterized protein n=1 Tax=Pleurodeles waltl TaxID=8319 RepID=A0AAV7UAU9_PLEWA|nr:hypothetical protein NDU88_002263 [Pleurodeles waltl]